jgi:hypothetical protein
MNEINENLWSQIQKPFGEELNAKHIFFELTSNFFIAVDRMGFRHILIESEKDILSTPRMQFRGVQLDIRDLVVSSGVQKKYLDLICKEATGYHIFNSIGGEIAQKMAEIDKSSDSLEVITTILTKWKHFWGNYPRDLMTMEEQIGLFGELFFLRHWLLPRYGNRVVLAWEGPNGGRHDFVLGDKSYEVKTSASSKGHTHTINGLDQLEDLPAGELFLISFWIRQNDQAAYSLTSVVESCRNYLRQDPANLSAFNLFLSRTGYSEIQRAEYEQKKYEILESALFLVDEHFPKVTPKSFSPDLPEQVEELFYTVNLNTYLDKKLSSSADEFVTLEM